MGKTDDTSKDPKTGTDGGIAPKDPSSGKTGATDWEARYKGLSKLYDEERLKTAELANIASGLKDDVATAQNAAEISVGDWQKKAAVIQADLDASKKERVDLGEKVSTLGAELAKFRVLKDHPDLMVYADLLPNTSDMEVLEKHVKRLEEIDEGRRTQYVAQMKSQMVPGSSPPTQKSNWSLASANAALEKAKADLQARRITPESYKTLLNELGVWYNKQQSAGPGS